MELLDNIQFVKSGRAMLATEGKSGIPLDYIIFIEIGLGKVYRYKLVWASCIVHTDQYHIDGYRILLLVSW